MAKRKSGKVSKKSSRSTARKTSRKSTRSSSRQSKSSSKQSMKVSKSKPSIMPLVKVYSTPTCPYCKMAKNFLASKKVKFVDIDVTSDPKYVSELQLKSGQLGVPVLDIGGKIVIGFDEKAIKRILKI